VDHTFEGRVTALILARKWTDLQEVGKAWLQAEPETPGARLAMITGLLFAGDYAQAHEQYELLFRTSGSGEGEGGEMREGREPKAVLLDFARQLVAQHPDAPGPRLFLGITMAQVGDLEAAVREYKETARLAPEDAFPHYFLGQAYEGADRLDLAIRAYREAIRLAPQDPRMRLNLGSAYQDQGNLESAIPQYREAIRLNPSDALAYYNLGLALTEQGRHELAINAFKEAARLNPMDPFVRYNLGIALEAKGRVPQAIAEFQAALQIAPALAMAHTKLGWIYYNQRRIKEAAESFQEAVKYNGQDTDALHGLGMAKLALGEKDDAINFLNQAYQQEERQDKKHLIRGLLIKAGAIPH
jgi:tetratricopeptide (TPR) repeat protein